MMEFGSRLRSTDSCGLMLLSFLVLLSVSDSESAEPQVNLTSGLWTGSELDVTDTDHRKIEVFLGVRYATPPLGKLRFQHPLPSAYLGKQSAKKMGPSCIQKEELLLRTNISFTFWPSSEDCLHLNIYRPSGANNAPIIVHYFGGSFYGGYNGMFLYDPEQLVARHNVIVVTVNYRVGAFGYLYLNSTEAPGNAALYDILLAAKFVKENARNLGGDPERITAWGQSSGAISLGMLMGSPLSRGLFKRAILQSGSGASGASPLGMNSLSNGILTASIAGCYNDSKPLDEQLDDLGKCLKTKDAMELFQTMLDSNGEQFTILFQPMAGIDDILPEFPFPADRSKIQMDPYLESVLITTVANEGSMFAVGALERYEYDTSTADGFIEVSWTAMRLVLQLPQKLARAALRSYFAEDSTVENARVSMGELFGDLFFECPADLHSDALAANNVSVYRLLWDHRPSTSYWPDWVGPTHYDDIAYMTGSLLELGLKAERSGQASELLIKRLKLPPTPRDVELMHQSLKVIGDFVHTGVPSTLDNSETWPKYSAADRATIRIQTTGPTVLRGPKAKHCDTWEKFLTNSITTPVYRQEPTVTEETSKGDSSSNHIDDEMHTQRRPVTSRKYRKKAVRASATKDVQSYTYVVIFSIFSLIRHSATSRSI